jgi:hypothetical protein
MDDEPIADVLGGPVITAADDEMPVSQFRPRGSKQPFYSPGRDLAYCYPVLFSNVCTLLKREHWEPWFADYLAAKGVTEADLAAAASAMVAGVQLMIESNPESPKAALEAGGFFATKPEAQLVLAARVGQVITGAFFVAVQQVKFDTQDQHAAEIFNTVRQEVDKILSEISGAGRDGSASL